MEPCERQRAAGTGPGTRTLRAAHVACCGGAEANGLAMTSHRDEELARGARQILSTLRSLLVLRYLGSVYAAEHWEVLERLTVREGRPRLRSRWPERCLRSE